MSGSTGRIALGVVGAVVGAYFGQPALGYAIGAGIGAIAFPDQLPDVFKEGPRLGDLRVMSSAYGRAMPIAFGVVRVAGNLIWSSGIDQHTITRTEDVDSGGGGGGKGGASQEVTTTSYTYSANFAISLCEGPIFGIRRVWANGEIMIDLGSTASYEQYIKSGTFASVLLASAGATGSEQSGPTMMRVYAGDETQLPDALILALETDAPAYRGTAYVMFENLQLARFNNGIPNLEFEVITSGTSTETLLQLDAVSQFGVAANGTITPDGLLLVASWFSASPYTSTLALVNPFDLSPIRDYNVNAYLSGVHVSTIMAPRMNGAGDILFSDENGSYWFWPAGGTPVQVSTDFPTRSWVDGNGNFYTAARALDLHFRVMQIRPGSGQVVTFRDLGTTGAGTILDLFDPRDGTLVYAYNGVTGVIEKLDGLSNAVLGTWVTSARPHSVCVAGDGSIWYLRGANIQLWRVNAAMTSEALILDTGSTGTGATATRLGRDWSNGDILWADGVSSGTMRRYDESGTLVSTLSSPSTPMGIVATDAAFPDRIYTFGPLGIFGTQFVHAYRALSIEASTVSVGDAISALCARVDLAAGDIDVTALTAQLRGYVIANRAPARTAIYQLMTAFMLDAVESSAKIKFVLRGAASAATINEINLGARLGTSADGEAYNIMRQQEPELPHELALNYLDSDANYQVGTQYGRRLVGHSANDQSLNLAVVLTADEAVQIAQTLLYEAWVARQQYKIAVSAQYAHIEPTDTITLQLADGALLPARVLRANESQGVRELELVGYEPSIYTQNAAGATLPEPPITVTSLSKTLLEVLDTALLREIDDTYGLLIAASGYTDNWPGCKIFKSLDGVTYSDAAISIPLAVAMGYSLTVLGNYTGGMVDETSTVDVSVLSGTLSSTTEAAVFNGANAAYLGGEIIQYKNAVLIDIGTYRLSGLLRGRLGTEWAAARHVVGQPFVKLDGALLRSLETSVSDQGVVRYFKGVTFGTPVAQAAAKPVTVMSNRLKPIAPAHIGGGRDASGNITINWVRRARKATAWVDTTNVPLDEPTEAYEVDLFAGSGTPITSLTSALDGMFGTTLLHGLSVGDVIYVSGVVGMPQVNNRTYVVGTVVDTQHFTVAETTAGYTAYVSGGTVRKKARTLTGITSSTTSYSSANQTTDYGSNQATVFAAVYQISSRVGRGYAGIGVI